MRFVVALDGPAAAGKGTLARRLAAASETVRDILNGGTVPHTPEGPLVIALAGYGAGVYAAQ